jgi:hypothetical protein
VLLTPRLRVCREANDYFLVRLAPVFFVERLAAPFFLGERVFVAFLVVFRLVVAMSVASPKTIVECALGRKSDGFSRAPERETSVNVAY